MENGFVYLFVYFLCFESCGCAMFDEPRCSKFDFEEKVLEKVVRFEHKIELITETLKDFSNQMKDNFKKMEADWTETKNKIELMKDEVIEREKMLNDSIHTTMQSLAAKIPESHHAFSAYDLSSLTPSIGSTLVFTHTLVNEDGVYSTTTGKFTAPCDGVYEFHATLTSGSLKKGIWVEFKAGEISIGKFNGMDYNYNHISSSGSAIGRLQKGIQVYIRVTNVHSGFTFREESTYYMNTFSGHLISK